MHTPLSVPADGATPELGESVAPPLRVVMAWTEDDAAEVTWRVVRDRDRIAKGLNDIVVRRLFSAGLALEMAMGLMGDHPGAEKVNQALAEIDQAIRDIRTVLFDHHQSVPGCGEQPD